MAGKLSKTQRKRQNKRQAAAAARGGGGIGSGSSSGSSSRSGSPPARHLDVALPRVLPAAAAQAKAAVAAIEAGIARMGLSKTGGAKAGAAAPQAAQQLPQVQRKSGGQIFHTACFLQPAKQYGLLSLELTCTLECMWPVLTCLPGGGCFLTLKECS